MIDESVTIKQAMQLIKSLPPHIASIMWGQPGLGKTKGLYNTFEPLGYKILCVLAGCSEPTDIAGIPFPQEDLYFDYYVPYWGFLCSKHPKVPAEYQGKMIIFIDDICTAPEQTQAAFFRFVHEGRIGRLQKRDNVKIVAASNRVDDKSAAVDMPMALSNRFFHINVRADSQTWLEWAVSAGIHPDIVGYIRLSEQNLNRFDDAIKKSSEENAFPTPRTWELLSDAFHSYEANPVEIEGLNVKKRLANGLVGRGVGGEFMTWVENTRSLIPPAEIIKDPETARIPEEKDIDIAYATVSNLEYCMRKEEYKKHWYKFAIYAARFEPVALGMILALSVTNLVMTLEPEEIAEHSSALERVMGKYAEQNGEERILLIGML